MVVAAGGTAGHVVPAMAVAAELRDSGAEVTFLGTRERIEAELVPAAGYEIDFLEVRGIDRRNPLRAARAGLEALGAVGAARRGAAAPRRRRGDGRRRLRRRPGRAGGDADPDAAGPDRGRQPPRPGQPAAGAAGAAGLPRLPDRGARGRALPGHRPAGAGGGARGRPRRGARRGSGSAPRSAACSSSAAARAPARSTSPRVEAFAERGRARLPRPPPRRQARLRGARRRLAGAPHASGYTLLAYEPDLGDVLAASRPGARPLGRLDLRAHRRRPAGDPRSLSARDRRPPERQRGLDGSGPARRR